MRPSTPLRVPKGRSPAARSRQALPAAQHPLRTRLTGNTQLLWSTASWHTRTLLGTPQGEISSLSLEPWTPAAPAGAATGPAAPHDACVVVSLFEVAASAASVEAFIGREHEFRFVAVEPTALDGTREGRKAVRGGVGPRLGRLGPRWAVRVLW